jgi:hypothetical protein
VLNLRASVVNLFLRQSTTAVGGAAATVVDIFTMSKSNRRESARLFLRCEGEPFGDTEDFWANIGRMVHE